MATYVAIWVRSGRAGIDVVTIENRLPSLRYPVSGCDMLAICQEQSGFAILQHVRGACFRVRGIQGDIDLAGLEHPQDRHHDRYARLKEKSHGCPTTLETGEHEVRNAIRRLV